MRFSGSRKLADTATNVKGKRAATAMSAYPRPTTTKVSGNGRETESAQHARNERTRVKILVARSNVSTPSLGPVEKLLNGSVDEHVKIAGTGGSQ